MAFESFYTALAQASFTLLALWWVLLQIRHDDWIRDTSYRHAVYDVSFYFLLPGMMSLGSLLAVQDESIWRWSFAVFGLAGAVESIMLRSRGGALREAAPLVRAADLFSILLYGFIALVAIWEGVLDELGIGLRSLELEGVFVTALLLLGVMLAATVFASSAPRAGHSDDQAR